MSGKLFMGGVPTQPDVDKLMKLDLKAGTSVSYEEIERITGNSYGKARFNTVLTAWRKRVFRERFLQSKCEGGAVHFLTADQAHNECRGGLKRVGRAAGRLRVKADAVDPRELTTSELQESHVLLRRESLALVEASQKAAKALARPQLRAVEAPRSVAD